MPDRHCVKWHRKLTYFSAAFIVILAGQDIGTAGQDDGQQGNDPIIDGNDKNQQDSNQEKGPSDRLDSKFLNMVPPPAH